MQICCPSARALHQIQGVKVPVRVGPWSRGNFSLFLCNVMAKEGIYDIRGGDVDDFAS